MAGLGVALAPVWMSLEAAAVPAAPPARVKINLEINGRAVSRLIDARTTLLDLLREDLGLTGTKKGCDLGQCGACTVLLNGERINSCLTLACMHDGDKLQTIEGLASGDVLHPLQTAFVEYDGLQCGYCTPGQICSAVGMLQEFKRGSYSAVSDLNVPATLSDAEVQERMSGNLCRCGAYNNIVAAIQAASGLRGV